MAPGTVYILKENPGLKPFPGKSKPLARDILNRLCRRSVSLETSPQLCNTSVSPETSSTFFQEPAFRLRHPQLLIRRPTSTSIIISKRIRRPTSRMAPGTGLPTKREPWADALSGRKSASRSRHRQQALCGTSLSPETSPTDSATQASRLRHPQHLLKDQRFA